MKQHITRLIDDEGAVSPVIGVILMVAITVILAAVIGTFVLGLGGQVSQTAPQASISVQNINTDAGTDGAWIQFKHGGSDPIAFGDTDIKISIGGSSHGTLSASDASTSVNDFSTADTLYVGSASGGTNTNAWLNGEPGGTGTEAYSTSGEIGSAFDLSSDQDYTVTFIDSPSGQVIAEKTGTA